MGSARGSRAIFGGSPKISFDYFFAARTKVWAGRPNQHAGRVRSQNKKPALASGL